jgi:hypothetical protein
MMEFFGGAICGAIAAFLGMCSLLGTVGKHAVKVAPMIVRAYKKLEEEKGGPPPLTLSDN